MSYLYKAPHPPKKTPNYMNIFSTAMPAYSTTGAQQSVIGASEKYDSFYIIVTLWV